MNASENPAEEPVSASVKPERPAIDGASGAADEAVAPAVEVAVIAVESAPEAVEAEVVIVAEVETVVIADVEAVVVADVEPEVVAEPDLEAPVVADGEPEAVAEVDAVVVGVVEPVVADVEPEIAADAVVEVVVVADVEPVVEVEAPVAGEVAATGTIVPETPGALSVDASAAAGTQPADAEPASAHEAAAALGARTMIVEEAEALAVSNEWSKASNGYRDLLDRWRAAGSAGRDVDNALWARFAAARDGFYGARNAHHAERAKASAEAAYRKKALIAECESLLEKSDPRAIGDGLDRLLEEWKQAGRAGAEDQTLWVQFRASRDRAFTLRRELVAVRQRNRETAKLAKEALIEAAAATPQDLEPDALQTALDEQMAAWKKVGSAGRDNDEALWLRFREARGAGFSRLRQVSQRREREVANAARSAEDAVEAAKRAAFSDAPVTHDEVTKLERQFERGVTAADDATKAQFGEAITRIKERATVAASVVPAANPFAAARLRQELTVRDLELRIEQLKVTGQAREVARVEKRLVDERAKLDRMAALIGG